MCPCLGSGVHTAKLEAGWPERNSSRHSLHKPPIIVGQTMGPKDSPRACGHHGHSLNGQQQKKEKTHHSSVL